MTPPMSSGPPGVYAAFDLVRVVLLFGTLAAAATTDTLRRRVSNALTYPATALGLALGFGMGGVGLDAPLTAHTLLGHAAGMLVGFGIFLVAWWARGVKGGEVKLAAAVGALCGCPFVVSAIFWTAVVGAIMALWVLVARGDLVGGLRRATRYAVTLDVKDPPAEDPARASIPYAVAMAFGTVWAFFLLEAGLA